MLQVKFIAKKSNNEQLKLYTLNNEYQTKLINNKSCFPIIAHTFFDKSLNYVSLNEIRAFFRAFGYQIEVTPIIKVDNVSTLIGKYRWKIACFDYTTNKAIDGQYIFYDNKEYDTYDAGLCAALEYIIDNLLNLNLQTTKNSNNMKQEKTAKQTTTTDNQVDNFVNELKNSFKEAKNDFTTGINVVKGFIEEFDNSEFKKEMSETAKEMKDKAINTGKKSAKFVKAMYNASKTFIDAMK